MSDETETAAEVVAHEPPPYETLPDEELLREVEARREAGQSIGATSESTREELIEALERNDSERDDSVFVDPSGEQVQNAAEADETGVHGAVPDAPSGEELEEVDEEEDDVAEPVTDERGVKGPVPDAE